MDGLEPPGETGSGERDTMVRAVLAVCCLAGIVLGGAFAPAVGIQTPVPDLGVEGEGGPDVGGGLAAIAGVSVSATTVDATRWRRHTPPMPRLCP
ncbi:MAG: hypothetical protein ACOCQM_03170 [Natronomonas sp.]